MLKFFVALALLIYKLLQSYNVDHKLNMVHKICNKLHQRMSDIKIVYFNVKFSLMLLYFTDC